MFFSFLRNGNSSSVRSLPPTSYCVLFRFTYNVIYTRSFLFRSFPLSSGTRAQLSIHPTGAHRSDSSTVNSFPNFCRSPTRYIHRPPSRNVHLPCRYGSGTPPRYRGHVVVSSEAPISRHSLSPPTALSSCLLTYPYSSPSRTPSDS